MSVLSLRLAAVATIAALGASACAPLRSHQGYVVDADLVNSVQPGVDNRESVLKVLGSPTLTGQFKGDDWYYLARESRNYAFNDPSPRTQLTLRIAFDADGTVTSVTRTGMERIASVDVYGKETPTLGRKRSFFEQLFGGIGTVGAPGTGGAGGADGP